MRLRCRIPHACLRFYSCSVRFPCAVVAAAPQMPAGVCRQTWVQHARSCHRPIASEWFWLCAFLEFVQQRIGLLSRSAVFVNRLRAERSVDGSSIARRQQHSASVGPCVPLLPFHSISSAVRWFIAGSLCSCGCRLRSVRNIHSTRIVVQIEFFVRTWDLFVRS